MADRHPGVQVLYGYDALEGVFHGSAVASVTNGDGQILDVQAEIITHESMTAWLAARLGSWHYVLPRILPVSYPLDDVMLEVGDVVWAKWKLQGETGDREYHWGLDGSVRFRVTTPPLLLPGARHQSVIEAQQILLEVLSG